MLNLDSTTATKNIFRIYAYSTQEKVENFVGLVVPNLTDTIVENVSAYVLERDWRSLYWSFSIRIIVLLLISVQRSNYACR